MLEKLFTIKSDKLPGPVPIVISPTYVARGGQIGFAPNNNDVVPFTYNLPDGPVENIPVRTAQYYAVAITLPFLKTPKMFGTFTVAPQWLVHTAGANVGNSMQFPQVLYLEYTPIKSTTFFFEPQSARDYLPTDPYPEHLIAYFLGVSQRLTKYAFVSVVLNSGNPTNLGPDGVTGIKCLTVQQAINNACGLAIGGLKATQLQLQFGLGSPNLFPVIRQRLLLMRSVQLRQLVTLALIATLAACGGAAGGSAGAMLPSRASHAHPQQSGILSSIVGVGDSLTAGYQSNGFLGQTGVRNSTALACPRARRTVSGPTSTSRPRVTTRYPIAHMYDPSTSPLPLIKGPGFNNQIVPYTSLFPFTSRKAATSARTITALIRLAFC